MKLSDFGLCKPVDVAALSAILENDAAQQNRRGLCCIGLRPCCARGHACPQRVLPPVAATVASQDAAGRNSQMHLGPDFRRCALLPARDSCQWLTKEPGH